MIKVLLFAWWFFLPAGLANLSPMFAHRIPGLRQWQAPIDLGKSYKGKRLLGKNKTWRGLLFGVGIAGVVATFQYFVWLPPQLGSRSFIFMLGLGCSIGFGALLGDAVESFFKRRHNIPSGKSWFPFDQTDYVIGGLLLSLLFIRLPIVDYLVIFAMYFCLHLLSVLVGYKLGFKEEPI